MDVEIIFTEIIKLLNYFQMILVHVGLLTTSWTPLRTHPHLWHTIVMDNVTEGEKDASNVCFNHMIHIIL